MKKFAFTKYLARSVVYWRMVELYYLCVDIRNYSTAVHLKGVSPLFNNYSKSLRLLPLTPHPSNNVAFHQVEGLTLTCKKYSEELLHFQTTFIWEERNWIFYFLLIIYYSEDSWNNTRFGWVGGLSPNMASARFSEICHSKTTLFWGGGREDMLFSAFIIN